MKDVTEIFEITSSDEKNSSIRLDKFITPYVKALAIIASKSGSNECSVTISIYSCKKKKSEISKKTVSYKPEKAKEMLQSIYNEAFGEAKFSKCVPVNLLEKSSSCTTIYELRDKLLDEHGEWAYFDKKNLFNPITDVGYTVNGFKEEWVSAVDKMKQLTAFSPEKPTDSDNN